MGVFLQQGDFGTLPATKRVAVNQSPSIRQEESETEDRHRSGCGDLFARGLRACCRSLGTWECRSPGRPRHPVDARQRLRRRRSECPRIVSETKSITPGYAIVVPSTKIYTERGAEPVR
jgi:hypothetical protein